MSALAWAHHTHTPANGGGVLHTMARGCHPCLPTRQRVRVLERTADVPEDLLYQPIKLLMHARAHILAQGRTAAQVLQEAVGTERLQTTQACSLWATPTRPTRSPTNRRRMCPNGRRRSLLLAASQRDATADVAHRCEATPCVVLKRAHPAVPTRFPSKGTQQRAP